MKSNIIEAILILIIIILIIFLVWNHFNYLNEKIILENEYGYNSIKLEHTENTITTTKYTLNSNPVKYVDIIYIEDGKMIKYVNELHYHNINSAQKHYEMSKEQSYNSYDSLYINKNIVAYTYNDPEYVDEVGQKVEYINIHELITELEERFPEIYPEYKRVY